MSSPDHLSRRGPWRLGTVGALLGGATVMAQAAADARFLSELGVVQLALATSLSSALLALVLAVVGGASDRRSGGRVLATLLGISAVALVGLAGLWAIAPRAAAWAGVLGVKQLAAAAELAFWMAAAERLDARQSVRALPRLSAIGGIGAAVSAALAVPLARVGGSGAVLVGAAGLMAVASVVALGMPAAQRMGGGGGAAVGSLIARAFRDGAAAVIASPLARQLAQLVAVGGGFAALVFLGVAAAASEQVRAGGGGLVREPDAALVALLAALRSAGQIATVAAQLFLAPWLLGRLGTGWALLVAPLGAVIGAAAVLASPGLLAIGVVSVIARALDQALETPAQKLVHTLLAPASRGRVVGFVEGLAKRSGGIAAGLLAALLVSQHVALGAALLVSALLWLWAAGKMARRLPSLAVTPHGQAPAAGTMTLRAPPGARALEQLGRELAGGREAEDGRGGSEGEERARRAAEVLVALAADGHAVACGILVRAAAEQQTSQLWRAATWALAVTPSRKLAAAWREPLVARLDEAAGAPGAGQGETLSLLLDARALCGGAAQPEGKAEIKPEPRIDRWLDDERAPVAFAAQQARSWMTDPDAAIESAGDELRFGDELRLDAAELVCRYTARALADHHDARAFAAGWQLVVVLRRELGAAELRARALEQMRRLVQRLSGTRTAELALLRAELALLGRRALTRRESSAVAELVGWLQLLGALGAAAGEPNAALSSDDLSLVVALLGDRDEELADAAEDAVRRIGVAATPALVQLAGYGRRAARDRAAALLRELPATDETLDQLVERELSALDEACLGLGAFAAAPSITPRAELDALLLRSLDERTREIAHTISLLVTARRRAPAIGTAAAQWRTARGRHERARALAVLDTTLPRPLAARLLPAVDERPPLVRARAVAARTGRELPPLPDAISAELRGADASSRRILLDSLPDLAAHRDALTSAAHHLASAADPHRLLRRLATPATSPSSEGADMPSHVETLLVLSKVPLLADLSTRQLDELARKTTWKTVSPGQLLLSASTPLDALLILVDAELTLGSTTFPAGSVVDDLAWFAPRPLPSDLLATRAGRILSIDRSAFEDLADDVPGLGASLTRALAERLR